MRIGALYMGTFCSILIIPTYWLPEKLPSGAPRINRFFVALIL